MQILVTVCMLVSAQSCNEASNAIPINLADAILSDEEISSWQAKTLFRPANSKRVQILIIVCNLVSAEKSNEASKAVPIKNERSDGNCA